MYLAVLAAYLATTEGSPTGVESEARSDAVTFEASQPMVNDCGDSTFEDRSSNGSPLISECQHLASNIAGGGTWTIGESNQIFKEPLPLTELVPLGLPCGLDMLGFANP
ncbi:uncharacterized protein RAG0_05728 [Rhynchosporium agropyri]|uniref:Ecp2 effector protein-like domain-containing protein n=1 Tax=Rhynchosporium agropyri TaxID=914238 RepID=A0A1E1KE80_9HELO|nr:uncharacterized protein RAG0_05728 [Rhynchosporium agropyri]